MTSNEEITEFVKFNELYRHLDNHNISAEIANILKTYAKIENMECFDARKTLYDKRIINQVLSDNKWPIINFLLLDKRKDHVSSPNKRKFSFKIN